VVVGRFVYLIFSTATRVLRFSCSFLLSIADLQDRKNFCAALHKQILVHGRLFLTDNFLVFHSNILGVKTTNVTKLSDVVEIKKSRKGLSLGIEVIGNADDPQAKLSFASFFARDRAYRTLVAQWSACRLEPNMSPRTLSIEESDDEFDDETGDGITNALSSDDDDDDDDVVDRDDGAPEEEDLDESVIISSLSEPSAGFLREKSEKQTPVMDVMLPDCSSVAQFFMMFWADGRFFEKYHASRGDDKIEVSEWKTLSSDTPSVSDDSSDGDAAPVFREAQWVAPYDAPFFAKSSPYARCEETQRYHLTKNSLFVEGDRLSFVCPK
jgi:GRAM domain